MHERRDGVSSEDLIVCMNRKSQPLLVKFSGLVSKVDMRNGLVSIRLNFGKVIVILQWCCRSRTEIFVSSLET
jgi:hypothetical protein